MIIIYRVTYRARGWAYIGITSGSAEARWAAHVRAAHNRSKTLFHRTLRKHGCDAFRWEVLEFAASMEDAKQRERQLIARYNTMAPNGFNLTSGGEGVLGFKLAPEVCARMSAALKGKKRTPEQCARIAAAQVGKKLSQEHKDKLSKVFKGGTHTPEARAKISARFKGVPKSPEHTAKVAVINRQRAEYMFTDEYRAKMSAIKKGHIPSAETRAKMSEAAKARWLRPEYRNNVAAAAAAKAAAVLRGY